MTKQINALSVQNVTISYGAAPVVNEISLDIAQGETFGLIGLNGAGKTTLIKAILGLRGQEQGEISVLGRSSSNKSARENLAFLPERFEPPWFLSGVEFVKFSQKMYRQPFSEKKVYEMAESLALDTKALKRRVQTYSKGMRQKLGLIATLLTQCNLLVLDEPMSGLDPRARNLVKKMLVDHGAQKDRTIFLSSHILADMDEICDRVCVLDEGIIKFVGTPKQMKAETKAENLEQSFLDLIEKKRAA
ncbi:ABC transporter ATP-binding protein [Alphaproteobacteria bacterium]|nr:ABC transporter ATP-binding protein [Alphaproteobacteria bacterium]